MSLLDFFGAKPTVERLAHEIVSAAAAAGEPGWRFEQGSTSLVKDGSAATVHLVNLFLEYSQAAKGERRGLLDKYVTLLATVGREVPKLWTLAQRNVFAVIRSRHDNTALQIAHCGTGMALPQRVEYPWHGDLVIRIAYDFGPSMGQVETSVADAWGVSRAELLETATRNLRALPRPQWTSVAPGVLELVSSASYQESMFLRDDVWQGLAVAGEIVAVAPNRGVLLAAGADDATALEALLAEARACLQQKPWPLDPVIVTRRLDGWSVFEPEGRAAMLWRLHCKICLAGAYAEQREALQKHVGEDVYVADFTLMNAKRAAGEPVSFAVWTEGVPTLLPEADLLVFNRTVDGGASDATFVRWADAYRICAARMTAVPEHPPRWSVAAFPGAEELAALKAVQFEL